MKLDPVSPNSFRKKFSASVARVEKTARLCAEQPTSDAVHEARIAIRKVMAAVSLMPKEYRNDVKTKMAINDLRLFYRACAEIRDIDVIEHALSENATHGSFESIIHDLGRKRSALLSRAAKSGDKFKGLRIPSVKLVAEKRLRKRLTKQLQERTDRALRFYKSASGSERRVTELHKLRKECRRMMYLLGFAKQDGAVNIAKAALEEARTTLGSIRDDDLLLEVLGAVEEDAAAKLAAIVSSSRRSKYERFFAPASHTSGGPMLLKIFGVIT